MWSESSLALILSVISVSKAVFLLEESLLNIRTAEDTVDASRRVPKSLLWTTALNMLSCIPCGILISSVPPAFRRSPRAGRSELWSAALCVIPKLKLRLVPLKGFEHRRILLLCNQIGIRIRGIYKQKQIQRKST